MASIGVAGNIWPYTSNCWFQKLTFSKVASKDTEPIKARYPHQSECKNRKLIKYL